MFNDNEIVILDAIRTPIGKFGGSLKDLNSGVLATHVIKNVLERSNIEPEQVDEVIMGEVRQSSESSNVARVAALRAGIPESKPAFTVNRLCASSMQAIASAVQQIAFNQAEIVIAGGTENMSLAPVYLKNSRFSKGVPQVVDSNTENGQQPQEIYGKHLGMGVTAENLADKYNINQERQDEFALESQKRAKLAIETGKFKEEIVPIEIKHKREIILFDEDEHPRFDTTLEALSRLKPVFKENGSVTAGNSSGRNDGACAMIITTASKAKELGVKPLVKIKDWATAGVNPEIMGIGPVPAVHKLLERMGQNLSDFGVVELNEAFAAQSLAVLEELKLDLSHVNVNGGAIALGHPLGTTGARISTTLLYEMLRRDEQYGLATLCVGGGQGMALSLELI